MNLSALILAAGSGSRIGKPKLMLEHDGKSFLKIIADKIRNSGIKNIICVVSADNLKWAMKNVPEIKYVTNPAPEKGMISSVQIGVKEFNDCNSLLIIPVDHPFVEENTFEKIAEVSKENRNCVIKPVYKERSGHPVIIPAGLIKETNKTDFSKGLDALIKESGISQLHLQVDDSGILRNINTSDDLK